MKLPRPRFTIRRLMVAVAIAAFAFGGWQMRQRREHRLRLALKHEVLSALLRDGHADTSRDPERADRHKALHIKYEHAARYPWLPIEPDPPEPED
jgi:hypothetical protein